MNNETNQPDVRPNVVYIASQSPFDFEGDRAFLGGAERYLIELTGVIREFGYDVEVYQPAQKSWLRFFHGIPVYGIPCEDSRSAFAGEFYRNLATPALTIYFALFLVEQNAFQPSIGISHGIYWDNPGIQKQYGTLQNLITKLSRALDNLTMSISVDANTINFIRACDFERARKLTLIPNFVDTDVFVPREDASSNTGELTILFPRRFHEARGSSIVREIIEPVLRDYPSVRFLLAGQPSSSKQQAFADELAAAYPDRLSWRPYAPDEMPEVFRQSDITILPTLHSEGTSLACLEAMASGSAMIATPTGGLPELITDGVNGLLASPDSAGFLRALDHLIKSPDLRRRLAYNARQTAISFSLQRWRERWRNVLDPFLASQPPGRQRGFVYLSAEDSELPGQKIRVSAIQNWLSSRRILTAVPEPGIRFRVENNECIHVPDDFRLTGPTHDQPLSDDFAGSQAPPFPLARITIQRDDRASLEMVETRESEILSLPALKVGELLPKEAGPRLPLFSQAAAPRVAVVANFAAVDTAILASILAKRTDLSWVLVGPNQDTALSEVGERSHVFSAGNPNAQTLAGILRQCGTCWIPPGADGEPLAEADLQVGMLSLSVNVPVVAPPRKGMQLDFLFFAESTDKILGTLDRALGIQPSLAREPIAQDYPEQPESQLEGWHSVFDSLFAPPSVKPRSTNVTKTSDSGAVLQSGESAKYPSDDSKILIVDLLDRQLRANEAERARLMHQLLQNTKTITRINDRYSRLMEADRAQQQEMDHLREELAGSSSRQKELKRQLDRQRQEAQRLSARVTELTSTRWFRAASSYWHLRERLGLRNRPASRHTGKQSTPRKVRQVEPENGHGKSGGGTGEAGDNMD